MGQGSVDEFGEDLFDDRVSTMLLLGLDEHERAVGERGRGSERTVNSSPWASTEVLLRSGMRRTINRAVTASGVFSNAV